MLHAPSMHTPLFTVQCSAVLSTKSQYKRGLVATCPLHWLAKTALYKTADCMEHNVENICMVLTKMASSNVLHCCAGRQAALGNSFDAALGNSFEAALGNSFGAALGNSFEANLQGRAGPDEHGSEALALDVVQVTHHDLMIHQRP